MGPGAGGGGGGGGRPYRPRWESADVGRGQNRFGYGLLQTASGLPTDLAAAGGQVVQQVQHLLGPGGVQRLGGGGTGAGAGAGAGCACSGGGGGAAGAESAFGGPFGPFGMYGPYGPYGPRGPDAGSGAGSADAAGYGPGGVQHMYGPGGVQHMYGPGGVQRQPFPYPQSSCRPLTVFDITNPPPMFGPAGCAYVDPVISETDCSFGSAFRCSSGLPF